VAIIAPTHLLHYIVDKFMMFVYILLQPSCRSL